MTRSWHYPSLISKGIQIHIKSIQFYGRFMIHCNSNWLEDLTLTSFVQSLPASWSKVQEAFTYYISPILTCVLICRAGGWGVVQAPLHGMPGDKAEWHQPRRAWPAGSWGSAGTEWWVTTYSSIMSGGLSKKDMKMRRKLIFRGVYFH